MYPTIMETRLGRNEGHNARPGTPALSRRTKTLAGFSESSLFGGLVSVCVGTCELDSIPRSFKI